MLNRILLYSLWRVWRNNYKCPTVDSQLCYNLFAIEWHFKVLLLKRPWPELQQWNAHVNVTGNGLSQPFWSTVCLKWNTALFFTWLPFIRHNKLTEVTASVKRCSQIVQIESWNVTELASIQIRYIILWINMYCWYFRSSWISNLFFKMEQSRKFGRNINLKEGSKKRLLILTIG